MGHEPRPTGWTDPDRVAAYLYNTATGMGLDHRVPDAPFLVETFCMGDHGIVSGYQRIPSGDVEAVLGSGINTAAHAWGIELYRSVLYACCEACCDEIDDSRDDVRPLVPDVMDAFWCHPTRAEALA